MIPFVILLIVPIFMQHVYIREIDYERKNKRALGFFFLFLTVLCALRHESVGTDTRNYVNFFAQYTKMSWDEAGKSPLEVGFSYFNKMVSIFSIEPQFFLAVSAFVVSAMIYPTYKRLSGDSSLTIVLFCIMSVFVMMFSGIRQMLAVGTGFVAYEFTRKKKLILFIIAVIIAMAFHASAFILFFMYPLYRAKITGKWLYAVIPVLAVIFIFNRQIFSILALLLEQYTRFESDISSTGAYTMLILFAIFTVFAFVVPDEALLDRETVGLRNFLMLSLAVQMFAPLHMLAMRMNYYYIIYIPLLLPKIIECRSERWEQVAIWGRHIMVLFFLVYFFINAYSGGNLNVFPYHFFWETVV